MSIRSGSSDGMRIVVYWRQADWGLYHRRNEAFARFLSRHPAVAEVIHVEMISAKGLLATLVRALIAPSRGLRAGYRLHLRKALQTSPVRVTPRLAITSLVVPGFAQRPLFRRMAGWSIRRLVQRLGAPPSVMLGYPPAPYLAELGDALRPRLLAMDLVDDVPAQEAEPARRAIKERAFTAMLPRCAAVFATSPALAERYGDHARCGIEFLPNGVDVVAEEPPEATYSGEHRRRRAVYAGSINHTLDRPLVEYLLARNRDVDFVFIGPLERDTADFVRGLRRRHPNFEYLGRRQYDELQEHLQSCDVLLNLKRADHRTRGNDSIKLYQYLATGKPVVSTSMSPADRMRDVLYVSDSPERFHGLLALALVENDGALRGRRRQIAAENAWERRVERIVERFRDRLYDADAAWLQRPAS